MRVFITGATGYLGSALVPLLLGAGHQVLGLSRSDKSDHALAAAGAEAHRGALDDLDSLRRGAEAANGVIHAGFVHDFTDFAAACATDRRAIETLGAALLGTTKPLIVTSGTMALPAGHLGTETTAADIRSAAGPRVASEEAVLALAAQGVHASIVRLSPSVHGAGDHGFLATLVGIAREKGASAYIGDGTNRWPTVHRLDAAQLFRLALEHGATGARYHGVAEEGVPLRAIAEAIGRHLNLPVVSKSAEEAAAHFGWLSFVLGVDNPASSALTQQQLGWHPSQLGLLADLHQGHYFKS